LSNFCQIINGKIDIFQNIIRKNSLYGPLLNEATIGNITIPRRALALKSDGFKLFREIK